MLTLGKNDFEAVEAFRGDTFASKALGLGGAPSCSTLRQRFDANASNCEVDPNLRTVLMRV